MWAIFAMLEQESAPPCGQGRFVISHSLEGSSLYGATSQFIRLKKAGKTASEGLTFSLTFFT